jgi:hypothetical protein
MPYRRPQASLTLEELPTNEVDTDGVLESVDELDDPVRAAKRRRIESLGEAYLQGTPLFIASASLNGPFDENWSNPWKKVRKQQRDPIDAKVIPETGSKKKAHKSAGPPGQRISSISVPHDDRGAEALISRKSYVTSTSRGEGREKPRRSLPWKVESTASHTTKRDSLTGPLRDDWLKKDRKSVDIQEFDPPKSPSARYAGSHYNVKNAPASKSHMKRGATLSRNIPPRQSDLRHIRRSKPLTGNSGDQLDFSKGLALVDALESGHKEIQPHDRRGSHAEGLLLEKCTVSLSAPPVRTDEQIHTQSSRSSVFIVPPSSRLPEFKYRRPKDRLDIKHDNNNDDQAKPDVPIPPDTLNKPLDSPTESPVVHDDILFGDDRADIPDSAQEQTSTGTVGRHDDEHVPSHPTESGFIPSAQIMPGQTGTFDRLVSLHSTEFPVDKRTAEEDDNHLSTQAALLLAQKSFQDDLATPEQELRHSPIPDHNGRPISTNKITLFSQINILAERNANGSQSFDAGLHSTMDTQAMIDAITPFSLRTSKKLETWMGSEADHVKIASTSKMKKKTSFAVSPGCPSPDRNAATNAHGLDHVENLSQTSLPRANTQRSAHRSSSIVPFMLSGSTPATVQQDGQGLMPGLDTFDVNQVIQDAGSWLKQSWDVGEELKHCSKKSTQSSSQTHRPAVSLV